MSVLKAADAATVEHPALSFAATGGARVDTDSLGELADAVRELAVSCGYPERRSAAASDDFDAKLGKLLHETSGLDPTEACRDEVWSFMGCLLLPDVVRWRFPGDRTSEANFLGRDRGINNALGRCWWAAEVLKDKESPGDPYDLLFELGVDETVGFSRRVNAVVNRRVAVSLARAVIHIHGQGVPFSRTDLMRDVMKRFLRLSSIVSFEGLSSDELVCVMRRLAGDAAVSICADRELKLDAAALEAVAASPKPERTVSKANGEMSDILSRVALSSRSPSRFNELKDFFARTVEVAPKSVGIKYLAGAKNYRNRVGEALRRRPHLLALVHSDDSDDAVLDAVTARINLSLETVVVTISRNAQDRWHVQTVAGVCEAPLQAKLLQAFDNASAYGFDVTPRDEFLLTSSLRLRLDTELANISKSDELPNIAVSRALEGGLALPSAAIRSKHVDDAKNLGNRISEALGVGATAIILSVPTSLADKACAELSRQLDSLPTLALGVIITLDKFHDPVGRPILVVQHESPPRFSRADASAEETDTAKEPDTPDTESTDDEGSATLRKSAVAEELNDLDAQGLDDQEPAVDFFELKAADEQADYVWRQLIGDGPLTKDKAVRLAAKRLRGAGHVQYGRLAAAGRLYQEILNAIEVGVREDLFDRPKRGYVRAILDSPDQYSRKIWEVCLSHALPDEEPIPREAAVRLAAEWARDILGLRFSRLRRNGKIDTGVRNAIRTMIRNGLITREGRVDIQLAAAEYEASSAQASSDRYARPKLRASTS
ncbi:MAG: DUF6339 family protein [Nannocystales bacterium]